MTEQESFWENESFVVVTDRSKPAMKWTIEELEKKRKEDLHRRFVRRS